MKNTVCYCCDNPAIGQGDHVPPMALFPKNSFSNIEPIIVPSCADHNQKKSYLDEYLKFILSATSKSIPVDVLGSTIRGITRHVTKNSKCLPNFGIEKNGKEIFIDDSAPVDIELLNKALEKVARGIYFHHSHGEKKLLGYLIVCPIFLGIDPLASPSDRERLMQIYYWTEQDIKNIEMLGKFKELFCYQVIENDCVIIINMKFYDEKLVSVMQAKI